MSNNQYHSEHTIFDKLELRPDFTDSYKNTVFWAWYDNGKPDAQKLKTMIRARPTLEGNIPSITTLIRWIKEDFTPIAKNIDIKIVERVQDREVEIKAEMFERHAEAGKQMVKWAMDYLADHVDKLNPHSAIRMLVEGVEIERRSRGLPDLITKISKSTDEDLMKQIQDLLNEGSLPEGEIIDLEPEEDKNEENT